MKAAPPFTLLADLACRMLDMQCLPGTYFIIIQITSIWHILNCLYNMKFQLFFFIYLCLYIAIALLWVEFVKEVRWCWEHCVPLPQTPITQVDPSACLVYQKLQMVFFFYFILFICFIYLFYFIIFIFLYLSVANFFRS